MITTTSPSHRREQAYWVMLVGSGSDYIYI